MYVIYYKGDYRYSVTEMSVKDYNEMKANEKTDEDGEIVYPYVVKLGAAAARKWVKEGNPHNTPLYIDMDGKVRYAKDMN